MNSYKNTKATNQTNKWFKSQGLNPKKCINPDLDPNFIRAKAATHNLLRLGSDFLTNKELKLLRIFRNKAQATQKQIFQILNLNKRIKRQLHKQV
jgi:hypothetical protein